MNKEQRLNMRFDLYIIGIILLPICFLVMRVFYRDFAPAVISNAIVLFYIIVYILSLKNFIKMNSSFRTEYIEDIEKWRHTIRILANTSFIILAAGIINLLANITQHTISYTGISFILAGLLWFIPSLILLKEIVTFSSQANEQNNSF